MPASAAPELRATSGMPGLITPGLALVVIPTDEHHQGGNTVAGSRRLSSRLTRNCTRICILPGFFLAEWQTAGRRVSHPSTDPLSCRHSPIRMRRNYHTLSGSRRPRGTPKHHQKGNVACTGAKLIFRRCQAERAQGVVVSPLEVNTRPPRAPRQHRYRPHCPVGGPPRV